MEILNYREYTSKFERRINNFARENHINPSDIISITNSKSHTTMWYWGLKD